MVPYALRNVASLLCLWSYFCCSVRSSPLNDITSLSLVSLERNYCENSTSLVLGRYGDSAVYHTSQRSRRRIARTHSFSENLLSRQALPSTLSHRSLRTFENATYHFISIHVIDPGKRFATELFDDIDVAMNRWISYYRTIDSYTPSTHVTLSLGSLRMEFWSPAPIPYIAITKIIELYMLLGMMWWTVFSKIYWEFGGNMLGVVVLMYAIEWADRHQRGDIFVGF